MAEVTRAAMIEALRIEIMILEAKVTTGPRHLAALRAALRELKTGGWRPIAYRVPVERHIAIAERDENRWAIFDGSCCLNIEGEWEVEPQPSSRDDAFKMRTRFTLSDAMQRAAKHFNLPSPPTTSEGTE